MSKSPKDRLTLVISKQNLNAQWPWRVKTLTGAILESGRATVDGSAEDVEGAAEYIIDNCGHTIALVIYPDGERVSL